MKELSIEEKAKRYDEAISIAREYDFSLTGVCVGDIIKDVFPELKESENERIRKELFNYLYDVHDDDEERARWIAYLEKQGEQKPAWNKEDDDNMMMIEDRFSDYLDYIREDSSLTKHRKNSLKEEIIGYMNWLKSLKDRVQQQEQMWSIEDEYNQAWIVEMLYGLEDEDKEYEKKCRKMAEWLKSLRPQNRQEWSDKDKTCQL